MGKISAAGVWAVVKDVVLTGLGVWILVLQALSPHPSDPFLVVAMSLCAPAIYDHAKAVLAGPPAQSRGGGANGGTSPSSPSAPPSSSPASSSSPGSDTRA